MVDIYCVKVGTKYDRSFVEKLKSSIEKHFTIDNDLPGRDNKFAILPENLKSLVNFRDKYYEMNRDLGLDLQDCEMDTFKNYRGRWSKNV